jgi:opacity protein-like surface antigen
VCNIEQTLEIPRGYKKSKLTVPNPFLRRSAEWQFLSALSIMNNRPTLLFCVILCAANASAQSAVTAGKAKCFDVSLGYSYMSRTNGQSSRVGLNGVDASMTVGLYSHLAIRADLGYARADNVLGTPSHSDVLSYMAGPVFYPTTQRHGGTYVHALWGGARVSGPVPVDGGILLGGWAFGYAWAVGGGVNYRVSDSMALRTGVDYVRTTYYGPSLTIQGQNNIRATVAVVYTFGGQSWRRRSR